MSLNWSLHFTYFLHFVKAGNATQTNKIAIWQNLFLGIFGPVLPLIGSSLFLMPKLNQSDQQRHERWPVRCSFRSVTKLWRGTKPLGLQTLLNDAHQRALRRGYKQFWLKKKKKNCARLALHHWGASSGYVGVIIRGRAKRLGLNEWERLRLRRILNERKENGSAEYIYRQRLPAWRMLQHPGYVTERFDVPQRDGTRDLRLDVWSRRWTAAVVVTLVVSSSRCRSGSSSSSSRSGIEAFEEGESAPRAGRIPMYVWKVCQYVKRVRIFWTVCVWEVSGSGLVGGWRGVCSRHVTAMYDTAWSDAFQEILFDVNVIHVNSAR